MIKNFCVVITQNKNLLMLFTASIYVFALTATLSGHLFLCSLLLTLILLFLLIKEYFPIKYVIIWTLIFYIGVVNISLSLKDSDELLNLAPINSEITGTIVSIPQGILEGKPKFFFKVDKIKFADEEKSLRNEKVLVTVNSEDVSFEDLKLYNAGVLTGRLSTPFKAGNPSQFDYGNYLRNHSSHAVFYAKTFIPIEKDLSFGAKSLQKISDFRERILGIHSQYLSSPNLEILGGIVFGDDAVSPPKDIKQSFANSGLLHILAASGMNVAFIYGFFYSILSLLRIKFKVKVVSGMIMVLIYSLMTGLGASVIRATCMLLFVLLGKLIDRDAHSISLLSLVALLMLIYNPLYINDVGFQLSFIVTFGILLMAPAVGGFKNKFIDFVAGTIMIPIISQLWVIPVQIFYFNSISLYSVFANIMSGPILMVLSFGGFISSLLSAITPIANFVCKYFDMILNPLLVFLVNISDFWGHLPNSSLQTTHPSIFQIFVYYGILLCIAGLIYKDFRNKHLKTLLRSLFMLVLILLLSIIPIKSSNLEILTFDVGNADSFLVKTPKNEYIMIDTGKSAYKGGKSQAEIIILKYLKDYGIKKFDSIIVSHFDNDHCGGVVDLVRNIDVNKIYVNDLEHPSYAASSIYKACKENNTEIKLTKNGQIVYEKDGLKLTNLLGMSTDNDNENSIITLLEYNGFRMLFTGDSSAFGIKEVLKSIPENITVLKVPHHGALGGLDKDVVNYLNPEYSIISVGENKFGHPALYTMELVRNSKILRTDINNAILIRVNKKNYKIMTFDLKKKNFI